MHRYEKLLILNYRVNLKALRRGDAIEVSAPRGAQWCNELVHNAAIDRSDQIIFLTNGRLHSPKEKAELWLMHALLPSPGTQLWSD